MIYELNNKQFINITVDAAVSSQHSCGLLAEGFYQYGIMLILMDNLIPGYIREAIIVSYYRYHGRSAIANMSDIIKICGTTDIVLKTRPSLSVYLFSSSFVMAGKGLLWTAELKSYRALLVTSGINKNNARPRHINVWEQDPNTWQQLNKAWEQDQVIMCLKKCGMRFSVMHMKCSVCS